MGGPTATHRSPPLTAPLHPAVTSMQFPTPTDLATCVLLRRPEPGGPPWRPALRPCACDTVNPPASPVSYLFESLLFAQTVARALFLRKWKRQKKNQIKKKIKGKQFKRGGEKCRELRGKKGAALACTRVSALLHAPRLAGGATLNPGDARPSHNQAESCLPFWGRSFWKNLWPWRRRSHMDAYLEEMASF